MNTIWIVLPILTLLMFELGLTLNISDFKLFVQRPRPVLAGLIGQIVLLPLIAFACACVFKLDGLFFVGVMLIACSPGGSSSNVFSMLAKGDIALSVSLTALSSIITLFTIPVIMQATAMWMGDAGTPIHLPVGNLIGQNLVLMLVPIALGVTVRKTCKKAAVKIEKVLAKIAFPALIFLASVFFVQHHEAQQQGAAHYSHRGWHAECGTEHSRGKQPSGLQQRCDSHTGHHLCPADECHPAGLCGCDEKKRIDYPAVEGTIVLTL